jgi:hypothetical protein
MDTTIEQNDKRIDSILAMVDVPAATPEVPLTLRMRLEDAKRKAYHAARFAGKSREEAEAAGEAACKVEMDLIVIDAGWPAPSPVQAPPKDPPPFVPPADVPGLPLPRPTPPSMPNIEAGAIDAVGAARSLVNRDAAVAAGFSPAAPVYERGSRVNETGVANARRSRVEHDKKPLVVDATTGLIGQIRAEARHIVTAGSNDIAMDDNGNIVIGRESFGISRDAFGALVSRLGYGGTEYLSRLPAKARAANVNFWREVIAREDPDMASDAELIAQSLGRKPVGTAEECSFRLRTLRNGKEEAFAVVSPEYTPFDADLIADAIRRVCLSTPTMTTPLDGGTFVADLAQARGRVTYDGAKSRFEVMFHSDIPASEYTAGEFFKAGVLIRSDDTGSGACRVVPVIWQNLCLNLLILDLAKGDEISIRHVGSVQKLTRAFEKAFKSSLGKIAHFVKAWGYACKEQVLDATRRAYSSCPNDAERALPGLFNGALSKGLVSIPGRRRDVVAALVEQWRADTSAAKSAGLTRASVVNALTRYAHTIPMDDPWAEDEIQRDAARLLVRASDPIPYVSLDEVVESTSAMARMS